MTTINSSADRIRELNRAQLIVDGAKSAGRGLTAAEAATVNGVFVAIEAFDTAAAKSDALLAQLAPGTNGDDGTRDLPDYMRPGAGSGLAKAGGPSWGVKAARQLAASPTGLGYKALFQGGVEIDPAVELVELPDKPRRLSDLIPRKPLTQNTFSYGRQIVRQENATTVPDGALKPTSVFTFDDVEDRARVVATLSEPIPLRLLEDDEDLARVLDRQLRAAVLNEIERLTLLGTGTPTASTDEWEGLLTTTGVQTQAFATDVPTTVRRARAKLEDAGIPVTAVVFNSADAVSLDLMREGGATGGYLMDSSAYERIFGEGTVGITSPHVPVGQAVLGDWSQVRYRPRTGVNTLMATQSGELFERNQAKLRTEQRIGFEVLFPGAFVLADLTA